MERDAVWRGIEVRGSCTASTAHCHALRLQRRAGDGSVGQWRLAGEVLMQVKRVMVAGRDSGRRNRRLFFVECGRRHGLGLIGA